MKLPIPEFQQIREFESSLHEYFDQEGLMKICSIQGPTILTRPAGFLF